MKKLSLVILLFSTLMNAQQHYNDYANLWKEVAQLEKDDLPKSANKLVAKIYSKAKKSDNAPQLVKALLYQSKFALTLEENAQLSIVHNFEKEITKADFPTKNILENVLANLYWQYFQQNRWQFYKRTNTNEKVDEKDFRTWDLHTIFKEIHLHFQNSLQNGLLAQKTSIQDFDTLLYRDEGSNNLRPTLYDFLAHNALDFYKTGESNLAHPAYKFEIDKPVFLADNNMFLQADFSAKDSLSQKRQALLLYKELTRLHQLDKNIPALIDLSLQRLDFVKENATFVDKDAFYLETLKQLKEQYKAHAFSTEIAYKIAIEYQRLGQDYQPEVKVKNQYKLREALGVCKEAINAFPRSNGAIKCENLQNAITQVISNVTSEVYVEPNKESRLLVRYKNTDKLFFRIYEISERSIENIQKIYNKKKKLTYITRMKEQLSFERLLKLEADYQQHAIEVSLPKLQQGRYLILASSNADFNTDSYSFGFIQSTAIALVEDNKNQSYNYQVVNRYNGSPLGAAKVHIYNTHHSRYNKKLDVKLTTDKNGFVSYQPTQHHNHVKIAITHKDDFGFFGDYNLYKRNHRDEQHNFHNNTLFLFTDRSIYRPGQTVYFKGIAVSQDENSSKVIANQEVSIVLKDVNYQEVKKLTLTTNEFGSFSGTFILPNSGLTGHHEIVAEATTNFIGKVIRSRYNRMYGSLGFSVEEYKRPKFSVHFNEVTENFKLNDSVKAKAKATAYAGSAITDAKVVYRVTRQVQYPHWWYWYRPSNFYAEAQKITHGETTINAKGEFEIDFLAQPDKGISKEDLPVFSYEITADVTDINGETRSATSIIRVGYHTLTATVSVAAKLDKKSNKNKIEITTQNLNGVFYPAKGSVKIYKLLAPENVLRKRPWAAPDYQGFSESEFKTLFPHDSYSNRDNIALRERSDLVFEHSFDTKKGKEIALKKIKNWVSGSYIIQLDTQDQYGQKVTDRQVFEVFSDSDKQVADHKLFHISLDKKTYKKGETAVLKIGSASKDLTVVVRIEKAHKIVSTKVVHLSDEIKLIEIPISEKDLGGFGVLYHFINYNAYKSGSLVVSVPYPKTDLEIETLTFRDKLKPDQEETWQFKIKGPKGDKVMAEVLTSMYDASLDQFKMHNWQFNPIYHRYYHVSNRINAGRSFGVTGFNSFQEDVLYYPVSDDTYQSMNWFGLRFGNMHYNYLRGRAKGLMIRGIASREMKKSPNMEVEEVVVVEDAMEVSPVAAEGIALYNAVEEESRQDKDGSIQQEPKENNSDFSAVKIRTNFNETAFFFPHLTTDKEGNVSFSFTTPESLTKWKLQLLSHTKDLNSGVKTLETVTQKELMLLPNPPRFLREGDEIVFSSKISNLTDTVLSGHVALQIFDAITNKPIDAKLNNTDNTKSFSVDAKGNTKASWTLKIPYDVQAVLYKIVAKSGDYADGEQNVLPILNNRMLVTETLPMWVRSKQTKTFTLDKLQNNTSKTLKNHKLTLEVTSNPAWYAVQALPYLMEYPYECAEQTFSRYYANTLASHIANSNPRIQQVFNQWRNSGTLLSNLEKNQELKSLIIQETPWLRDAQSETEQKKRIALLFDLHKMKSEQKRALRKLRQMQMSGGGFPWFKGARYPNRYITQHIVAGLGHLDKLHVTQGENKQVLDKAIQYLDNQVIKDYNALLKQAKIIRQRENSTKKGERLAKAFLAQNHTSHFQIHYLYTRSFFKDIAIPNKAKEAVNYYTNQSYEFWKSYNLYTKGLLALISYRNDKSAIAHKIITSLKENSITSEELGMYWKENTSSYYWYQAPIETQALLIEAFAEVENDTKTVDNLKIWLLKNKQTNRWKTTKATTEAVYALLLQGTDWLETTAFVNLTIGGQEINPLALEDTKVEAGTGYYKTSWSGNEITPDMATVKIAKQGEGIAWGAMYWQYFEDLDKITVAKTPLQLTKKLFLKTNESRGEKLTEITSKSNLKLGDLVRVRIELKVDRPMEFIHMKDMRASGFEPINVLSRYKWQDGLGYYESTKDASTNFFIDYLPKGVYVFEYDLRVNNAGDFSNGITTIQSMYAPEFSSHSKGIRVQIEK